MDIIEKLAQNVIRTKYESIANEVVEATKNYILNTLGISIAGASECGREVDLVKEWGGKEESTILVHGGKVPAPNAAWANSIMAGAFDFDDVIEGGLHVYTSAVPTALAMSEVRGGISGKEFITAITAGADLAARIHLASRNWEINTTGTTVVFGTAAIAARLLGLEIDGMLNALGIAFICAAGSNQAVADKVSASKLTFVSRSGIEAAILAQKGFTGVKNVLQGTYGFFRLFSRHEGNLNALTDQLGKKFEGVRASIKKYPSCGTTHTAIEAVLRIVREVDLDPKEINQVTVEVSEFVHSIAGHPFKIEKNPRVEAQYSLPYTVASAIVRKGSMLQHFTERYVRDPEVIAIADKVRPVISTKDQDLSALVEIEMKDGRKYSKFIKRNEAVLQSPFDTEEVKTKFRNCVTFAQKSISKENSERIMGMVSRLDEVHDVCELIKLLV
jgi:2-methylcitrate dehydratase PrpD